VSFAQPSTPEVEVPLDGAAVPVGVYVSWAPDGQLVAYNNPPGAGLWVADTAGNRSMISDDRVFSLDWSPDLDPDAAGLQTRIAFGGALQRNGGGDYDLGTYTIAPDGTDRIKLANAPMPKRTEMFPFVTHSNVHWSPSGSQVTYTEREVDVVDGQITTQTWLHRVDADGSNDEVLASAATWPQVAGLGWTID
jgi:hypothetical protein